MIKNVIWAVVFMSAAALLQSTVLSPLRAYIYAVPDIALIILVFTAYVNGTMTGQLNGFFSGIMLDFISSAPLGLNPLVRTLTGALIGLFKGTFFLDFFLLPMILCTCATFLKALIMFLLNFIFPETVPAYSLLSLTFWSELGLNTFLAPFVFAFLKLFSFLLQGQGERSDGRRL